MKKVHCGIALMTAIGLAGVCGCMSSKANEGVAGGELKSAEEAGWELVFTDTFDREELGPNWNVVDGKWEIVDGALRGSGTLISAKGFPEGRRMGFQRLEFDAITDVKPFILFKTQEPPKVTVCDISSFIHAQPEGGDTSPISSGYFFQFGGFNNTKTQIRKQGVTVAGGDEDNKVITPDKLHKIVAENDEGTLRLFVDGELVLEREEKVSIMGEDQDRVGFYLYTAAKIPEVKVYVKKLPDGLDLDMD